MSFFQKVQSYLQAPPKEGGVRSILAFDYATNPRLVGPGERIGGDRFFEGLIVGVRSEGRAKSIWGKGPTAASNNETQYAKNTTHGSHRGHTKTKEHLIVI